jgi:hypothetical protein
MCAVLRYAGARNTLRALESRHAPRDRPGEHRQASQPLMCTPLLHGTRRKHCRVLESRHAPRDRPCEHRQAGPQRLHRRAVPVEGGRVQVQPGPPLHPVHVPEARHPIREEEAARARGVALCGGAQAGLCEGRLADEPEGRVGHRCEDVEPVRDSPMVVSQRIGS